MTMQRRFPVIVQVVIRNRNVFGTRFRVNQAIIVVFVYVQRAVQLVVINPDIAGRRAIVITFNRNGILRTRQYVMDLQVLHNNVVGTANRDTDTVELTSVSHTYD